MISSVKSIQIIVGLLKGYNIKKIVFSGGTRNIPLMESIIHDEFFECFYHADERTASYIGLGLAVKSNEIVALSCTSGTALANYCSAIAEAYYQHVPLLVLSADRRPYLLNQNEDQMINQPNIFANFIKKSVDLPEAAGPLTSWTCRRLVCEAINELRHGVDGPVQINYRIGDENFKFDSALTVMPDYGIKLYQDLSKSTVLNLYNELQKYKRIVVLCGQSTVHTKEFREQLDLFCSKFNAVAIYDALSNIGDKLNYGLNIAAFNRAKPSWKNDEDLFPDLVIHIDGRTTFGVNGSFKSKKNSFAYWYVNKSGEVSDFFRNLSKVIQGDATVFFKSINDIASNYTERYSNSYLNKFKVAVSSLPPFPEMPLCGLRVCKDLMEAIPNNSLVHLGILDSLNHGLYFLDNPSVQCYSNRATWGIDGSLASFVGQSYLHNGLSFMLMGDLSFFYGMNAIWNSHIKSSVRILVNNNNGTSTIESNARRFGLDLDAWGRFQGEQHNTSVKSWVESLGFKYLSAKNLSEFKKNLLVFTESSDRPIVFEVFTDNAVNHYIKSSTTGYFDKILNSKKD